ncbi:response regulator [Daejeonella sp.]|uniref:response regulator n=1 Tax=Daejeonella sp. TaxID=2805397 RepID=UPI0030C0B93E
MSKVFIIDDDPIHQRIAQIMIAKHELFDGYSSYTEAELALECLRNNVKNTDELPDVILLDLNMPVMDGWDFLEAFERFQAELSKSIRIFIVTSSVDEKDKLRSQTFSFVKGFISKPLSPDIIRGTLA